jgi:hypothetical protein
MFGRRSPVSAARGPARDVTVLRVVVDDRPGAVAPPPPAEAMWAALRRLVAEALILQDTAEDLLNAIRDHRPDPADVARPCGDLRGRFVELRAALPSGGDPDLTRCTEALAQVFDHHVLMLKTSWGLLAGAERSELLAARLDDIDGLGAPARRLEAIRAEILARAHAVSARTTVDLARVDRRHV